jgi:hypothetical protein
MRCRRATWLVSLVVQSLIVFSLVVMRLERDYPTMRLLDYWTD